MPKTYTTLSQNSDCGKVLMELFSAELCEKLILKPLYGSAGRGILLAEKSPEGIIIKGKGTCQNANSFIVNEPYLVEEVVVQDEAISAFAPFSVNTIRTVPILTKDNTVILMSASMRFSVGESFVDNWSAGGIAVGVDCKNGSLLEFAYDKKGNMHTHHPVSKKKFNGFSIPFWGRICELTDKAQKESPFYRLIGLDVAITPKGPIVIEINANPDLIFQEQTGGPLLKDPEVLREFARYDLLYNKQQKNLLKKLS